MVLQEMLIDSKKVRSVRRRFWKKIKPYLNWSITAAPAVFAALLKFEPKTAPLWASLVMGASGTQVAKDIWKERKDRRRIQSPDFFGDYIELLTNGVSLMQDVSEYSLEAVQFLEQQALQAVCDMVALYYDEHKKPKFKDKFNANIMVPQPCADWLENRDGHKTWKSSVKFFDVNRNIKACSHVLVLTDWAKVPRDWQQFVLPVEEDEDYLLPGAPRAFAKDQMQVCSDTLSSEFWNREMSKHAAKATRELRNYFEDNGAELRSFFSIPLHAGKESVGVLNVQSNDVDILGVDAEHREDLEMCLRPFCGLLAALIKREDLVRKTKGG